MNAPVPENLLIAFGERRSVETAHGLMSLRTVDIGELILPTGSVIAGDPLYVASKDYDPFSIKLQPGTYSVDAVIASCEADERIACVRLRANQSPEVGFEESSNLAHGVDNAAWCFVDQEAAEEMGSFDEAEFDAFWKRMRDEMQVVYAPTRSWATLNVSERTRANMVVCDSGYGDGCYASYYAFGIEGQLVSIISDFGVLATNADIEAYQAYRKAKKQNRPWWRFW